MEEGHGSQIAYSEAEYQDGYSWNFFHRRGAFAKGTKDLRAAPPARPSTVTFASLGYSVLKLTTGFINAARMA